MLPEPTLPKRRRAATAQPQPWAMTPLFAVPDNPEPDVIPPPARQAGRRPGPARRPNSRLPAGRASRGPGTGKAGPHREPADLLAVTAERLRRALGRSFLRYGIPGDLEAAIHAAMNVIEPVLDARDTEILRLRRLMGAKLPGRLPSRLPAGGTRTAELAYGGLLRLSSPSTITPAARRQPVT